MGYAGSEIGDLEVSFLRDLLLDVRVSISSTAVTLRLIGAPEWTGAAGGSAKTWSNGIGRVRVPEPV